MLKDIEYLDKMLKLNIFYFHIDIYNYLLDKYSPLNNTNYFNTDK